MVAAKRLRTAATAVLALMVVFIWRFEPSRTRWSAGGVWLATLVLWCATVWSVRSKGAAWQPRRALPLALLLVIFAAVWLPFYNNWRWAFTGDSMAWFEVPYGAAVNGLHQSLLSVHGVDDNFTYLHSIAPNALMVLIEPTLFWHRVGKLLVSAGALASIYLFFLLTIGRAWALVMVFAVATNYVWIWFSYVSYGHVASYVFAFLSLAFATLTWRTPENHALWMTCGLIGGFALYFTQTAWAEVAAVGAALTVGAARLRRPDLLATYGITFAILAVPLALQWPDVAAMFTRNAGESGVVDGAYYWRIFWEVLQLPITSETYDLGVHRGFLRAPLNWLYVAGIAVAAVGSHPRWRTAWQIPAVAPVILALLLFDAVLMAFTNNAYGNISTKRAYHLIPYYLFLALLPFIVLHGLGRARAWARTGAWVATGAALAVSLVANARLIISPPHAMYGFNVFDGLIELRQRQPDQLVALFTSRGPDFAYAVLSPESPVAREYEVTDIVVLEERIDADGLAAACMSRALVCYEPEFDEEAFTTMVAPYGPELTRVELDNSQDMRCFEPLSSPCHTE